MHRFQCIFLILAGLVGASKAHHFIRVVILAGLGLAGLWMVHTLAQDYNKIQHNGGAGGGGPKFFEKRSVDIPQREINWEFVLSRDPARCARSFICQLAAQDPTLLDRTARNILELTRSSAQKDTWASKQLLEALKYGEEADTPNKCRKLYKLCPYSSETMTSLLRILGG